jgi:hypothetical protein
MLYLINGVVVIDPYCNSAASFTFVLVECSVDYWFASDNTFKIGDLNILWQIR